MAQLSPSAHDNVICAVIETYVITRASLDRGGRSLLKTGTNPPPLSSHLSPPIQVLLSRATRSAFDLVLGKPYWPSGAVGTRIRREAGNPPGHPIFL